MTWKGLSGMDTKWQTPKTVHYIVKKKRVQIQTQHSSEDTKNQTINVATIKVQ